MDVAIFLPSLRIGGAERAMLSLARGFSDSGLQVDLVLAKAEGDLLKSIPAGVSVVDLGHRTVLTAIPPLVRYLRTRKPEAVLSALDHANIAAIIARRIAGVECRLVVTVHSHIGLSHRSTGKLGDCMMPTLIRITYPWANRIVAVSMGVATELAASYKLRSSSICVINNPVVLEEIISLARPPPEHPWFASGNPPVIISVGRLTRAKDFPTLIRAFAALRKSFDARLLIIGEGKERVNLEGLVTRLGLQSDVDLHGSTPNPYPYMARASVLVLSSAWEGFAIVLVEAMALGVPVVATNCPSGPSEILNHGQFGRLVNVGDAGALAQAIAETLSGCPDVSALRQRAVDFDVQAVTPKYLETLFG